MSARIRAFFLCVAILSLAACATNPATGKSELSLIPEPQEIEIGRDAAASVAKTMPAYPDPKLQQYVSTLGLAIAKSSERPNLPWTFTVLDDTAVNAFALPGGFIFVTRGILGHMTSEAELVSVLGHEIGHVTAKHSVSQMSKQQLAQIGLGIGMIIKPEWSELGQLAAEGLGLMFLKFSRDDEREADKLGFRYMLAEGYDPREQAKMFTTLDRYSAQAGSDAIPEWASTHPNPEGRVVSVENRIRSLNRDVSGMKIEQDAFLRRIDGITFGDDPRQGYFKGRTFVHPELQFKFDFPAGWKMHNQPQSVVGVSAGKDAIVELGVAGKSAPRDAASEFFAKVEGGRTVETPINGLDAYRGYFKLNTESGVLGGLATFVSLGGTTYRLLCYTTSQKLDGYKESFEAVAKSFSKVTDKSLLAVEPARIALVTADRDMTLEEFTKRYPSSVPLAQIALINGMEPGGTVRKGELVKRVTGGVIPE